mmetsp:Transcript_104171/g.277156  ORF Transcript_104171/g.277156 Transcript_104171/m.277156 type:complete len:296 (-) Transcript_104171:91-978(-)
MITTQWAVAFNIRASVTTTVVPPGPRSSMPARISAAVIIFLPFHTCLRKKRVSVMKQRATMGWSEWNMIPRVAARVLDPQWPQGSVAPAFTQFAYLITRGVAYIRFFSLIFALIFDINLSSFSSDTVTARGSVPARAAAAVGTCVGCASSELAVEPASAVFAAAVAAAAEATASKSTCAGCLHSELPVEHLEVHGSLSFNGAFRTTALSIAIWTLAFWPPLKPRLKSSLVILKSLSKVSYLLGRAFLKSLIAAVETPASVRNRSTLGVPCGTSCGKSVISMPTSSCCLQEWAWPS